MVEWGRAEAVVGPDERITYAEYDRRAAAVAERLLADGLMPGDTLGIVAPRGVQWLPLLLGCFRAGVFSFPVNTRLPAEAVAQALETVGCKAVVASADWREALGSSGGRVIPWETLAQAPPNEFGGGMGLSGGVVLLTSGSTGRPKAAVLPVENLWANAMASNENLALEPGNCWLLSLPLYHVSGLGVMFRCLAAGATVAVPDPEEDLAESIERYGVTHVSLVTTQLHRLLEREDGVRALSRLRAILLGGSGMPGELIRRALALGMPIRTSYGMTETASQVATTTAADRTEEALRWARPIVPGSVRISSEGEIEVNGPTLFQGYREGNRIERPLTADGWFATGDLGRMDADGRLTVLGRKDNLFISGGENIQPEEIERELCALEGVEQAIVVPVEDAEFGRRPVAFVKPPPDDPATLRQALAKRLPGYKLPIAFHPWPADLDIPGIKVQRQAFAQAARNRDRASSFNPKSKIENPK